MNIELARENMVEQQVRTWDVLDQQVLDAMRTVPREMFVPAAYQALAFSDISVPLAHGESMMPPRVEGRMLQALDLKPEDRLLEIGTGTGYTAALAARLAGRVDSIEIHPDFVESARTHLQTLGYQNVTITCADAIQGFEPGARYEAIAFTGAMAALPKWVASALTPGGRVFAVIGDADLQTACLFRRGAGGQLIREGLFETTLPFLAGAAPVHAFEF